MPLLRPVRKDEPDETDRLAAPGRCRAISLPALETRAALQDDSS